MLAITLYACKKDNALDCFKSNGSEITETRYPGTFRAVDVNAKIDINFHQGPGYKVDISAGEHIAKNVYTQVINDTLRIDNYNTCNFVRGYKRGITLDITLPYLAFVKNEGVGTVTISDFNQDTLVVRAESSGDFHVSGNFNEVRTSSHGNGDMYLDGTANSFAIYANGTNFVHAENLLVKNFTFVQTLTLGDCFVNATILQQLAYNIGSSGNIYYTGNPPVITDESEQKSKGALLKK